jgi:RNA polymerase sigma-70 factor, ECF subfamily
MDLQDFRAAPMTLPPALREALILVGGSELSYEEAAGICGCAVGTVKSRVNRARNRLAKRLAVDRVGQFGPDAIIRATISAAG